MDKIKFFVFIKSPLLNFRHFNRKNQVVKQIKFRTDFQLKTAVFMLEYLFGCAILARYKNLMALSDDWESELSK